MNRNFALALSISCAAATAAYADDITIDPHPFVSTLTRAQVLEELRLYRQAGVNPWADDYNPLAYHRSATSRAQVTADFMDSRGMVAALSGEDSGSSYLARVAAAKAHPPVTELAAAD